jgi:(2Fe-2S) ferredoxin
MSSKHNQTAAFELEGRFLSFIAKDGYKIKYLRLSTATGEYTVKISKDLRRSIQQVMVPGEWIKVSGWQTQDRKTGIGKFKADQLSRAVPSSSQAAPPEAPIVTAIATPAATPAKAKACILVCQKSDCCKRGGRDISKALEAGLGDRALQQEVTIKGTGCMKRCKAGPNIVMPDKTRYTRIRPGDVPAILEQHFPSQSRSPVQPAMPLEAVAIG